MKRILLAAALVTGGLAAGPAAAQYAGPGYESRPSRDYEERSRRDYDGPRRERFDRDLRRDYDEPRRGGYGRPDPRFSAVCVTKRGACSTGRAVPRGTPCGCEIPGFGYKRGIVN